MEETKLKKKKQKAISAGNRDNIANACRSLGDFYNQLGRYVDAIAEYKEEAKLYEKLKKHLDMAKANRMVAEMYMLLSEFDDALQYSNLYLKTVQKLDNKVEEQRALATLGRAHLLKGQSLSGTEPGRQSLKSAEKAFIQGLLVCKELSGKINKIELIDMQTRLYLNIGVVREHLEDFDQSMTYINKAIKISKENDLYELQYLCYVSASLLYFYKLNDNASALRYINLALEVVKCLPNRVKKECESLLTKSEFFIKSGDFYGAKQVLHKAYKIGSTDENDRKSIEQNLKVVAALCYTLDSLVTISSTDYAMQKKLYERMGDGCCLLENYKKAVDYYLKMLESAEKNNESGKALLPIYVSLYQTYKDIEDYDSALKYLWMELEINKNEPAEAFNTLCNIAEIFELQMQPFWAIHDLYQKAIDEAKKAQNIKLEKIAMVRLMKLEQKSNMPTMAENLKEHASSIGIDLNYDSDEENAVASEHNTPDIGDDICLEDLTDSENEADTIEAQRPKRKRGTCLTLKRNNKGETQLHQACISGNLQLVRKLIEQGHIVNVRDHAGWLPLHEACNHGFKDIVAYLLENGALSAINDKGGVNCDGITPLYDACSNGFLEVVEILLDHGAKATITTDFGDNPLSVLQKWRSNVELNPSEETLYEEIETKISQQLVKTGNMNNTSFASTEFSRSPSNECSPNKHKKFCFEDDDDEENAYSQEERGCSSKNRNDDENASERFEFASYRLSYSNERKASRVKDQYKDVMESIKHPNRLGVSLDSATKSSIKKSAFLQEDEVGENWLDEDVGPIKKKRKRFSNENISPKKKVSQENSSNKSFTACDMTNIDDTSNDSLSSVLQSTSRRNMESSKSLSLGRKKHKRQTSLLQKGFVRFRGDIEADEESSNGSTIEPDSTTTATTNTSSIPIETSQIVLSPIVPNVSFKIKVENEMLLVPVDRKRVNEVNIRWLAEEAARRYYNLVGIKPILRLMTSDGFAFEPSDSISVALNESTISSKVLDWKSSSLPQRYEEICSQMNRGVDLEIKSFLEKSQTLNTLSFGNLCLTVDSCQPVFKSILHQTVLCVLDLSNCFIQDEGCKHLSTALRSLKQLKTLNLVGNCITVEGLCHLNSVLKDSTIELEELSLSSNPLGDKSIRSLELLCQNLVRLKKLNISSCQISNFYDFNLQFDNLVSFNVGFNPLTTKTFKNLLNQLNSSKLEELNLNFTANDLDLGTKIVEFLQKGTCEKFKSINLSLSFLTDVDVYNIIQNLLKSDELEVIEILNNTNITIMSLNYMLEKLIYLKRIYLQGCSKILASPNFMNIYSVQRSQYPELIALSTSENSFDGQMNSVEAIKKFWENCHREGKILTRGKNIYFFIDDDILL